MNLIDYKLYVENKDNGLKKDVEAGDLIYTFQYKPHLYIAGSENEWKIKDSSKFDLRVNQLKKSVWFNVGVKNKEGNINPLKTNVSGLQEYNNRLNYFLMHAQENFKLYYNNEQMPQVAYFFENNYGLTPMDIMIIGFKIPDDNPKSDLILEYSDEIYNTGIIKIKIADKSFENINNIKITL